jgi:hypothetical protein
MWEIADRVMNQFGFNAMLVVLMGIVCYKLIKYVMDQMCQREKVLIQIIDRQTETLQKHTEQAKDFHNEVKTAHEFQREEHRRSSDDHAKQTLVLDNLVKYSERIAAEMNK